MSALKVRGLVMAAAFAGVSITAISAHAMGYGHGRYAMPPMPPPPAIGMVPYAMPGGYGHAPPAIYGRRGPGMASGSYGQVPQTTGQRYGDASSASTKASHTASNAAGAGKVNISQMRFRPATIEVKAGETVTWRNDSGGMPHTVNTRGKRGPRSGTLGSGQMFSHTFDEPGTYEYYCALHPSMTGTVVVQ